MGIFRVLLYKIVLITLIKVDYIALCTQRESCCGSMDEVFFFFFSKTNEQRVSACEVISVCFWEE